MTDDAVARRTLRSYEPLNSIAVLAEALEAEVKRIYPSSYVTLVVGVHGNSAYDTVDYPHVQHNGTSWRCQAITRDIRVNYYAPEPPKYETLHDEWLMLRWDDNKYKWTQV